MNIRFALSSATALAVAASPVLAADRIDAVTQARVVVRSDCLIAPPTATTPERAADAKESAFGLAFATMGAKFVGDLAGAGLNALGEAISAASQEHGYVAEGQGHFSFYETRKPSGGRKLADLQQKPACVILYVPSDKGVVADMKLAPELNTLNASETRAGREGLQLFSPGLVKEAEDGLTEIGLTRLPAVYVEAELWATPDGMTVRPVLVWYHQALSGAPSKATAAEFQATFATPANGSNATALGATFAVVEIKLPETAPQSAWGPFDLANRGFIGVPARPTSGSPEATLAATNALYAAAASASTELDQARAVLATTQRRLARGKTPDVEESVIVATAMVAAKSKAKSDADAALVTIKAVSSGTTNVQARFVVVRDANKLGLAIGAALKARNADLNAAVSAALTPKTPTPEWAATDTAYLQAATNITAKQREIDAAASTGDTAAVARLNDELSVLKAKANEAAIAASRPIPYPGLLVSLP